MDEIRTITIDPAIHPEPVYRTMLSAYTWLIELCYDVRVGDTEEMKEVSLFLSRLQPLQYDTAWKPFDHPGLKTLSRERALLDIQSLLAAKLPEDFSVVESLGDQFNIWLKLSAFVQGFKPWTYGLDHGIKPIWTGRSHRINLYNLAASENKREYTWDLLLTQSQEFVFDDPRKVFIPTLIKHTDRPYPEFQGIVPKRTYQRKKKE